MRRLFSIVVLLASFLSLDAQQVVVDNFRTLGIRYSMPSIFTTAEVFNGEKCLTLEADGYLPGGTIGSPAVPVHTSLLTIPFCQSVSVEVANAVYDTIALDPAMPILPAQPGLSKSDTGSRRVYIDEKAYSIDAYPSTPLASVQVLGVARDRRLAAITFSPVRINPVAHKAVVCRSADIRVLYHNADSLLTVDHYRRYHTPAFDAGATLNTLFSTKADPANQAVGMLIVAPTSLRCRRLEQFADWKRRMGLQVRVAYTDDLGLSTATSIANWIADLYNNATADSAAPTYVLLVGDRQQVPAFNSKATPSYSYGLTTNHITDLYYTTWTANDRLPDCYIGRFSATDTVTLAQIINKTILYENYSFDDDSYLGRAVLISGIDQGVNGDNGYNYSDPSMDYAAKYYVNSASGFGKLYYYKNLTTFAPTGVTVSGSSRPDTTAAILRNLYNGGIGWVNYSAHGEWNCWGTPYFSTADAVKMDNCGQPSFMIGNCCLSNKFDRPACLGETLLRRADNAGAVAYIGATNSTYWGEDFYWSVGVRTKVFGTMNATYDAAHLGIYDRTFHTHNESRDKQSPTAGSIVYFGNLAVQSTIGSDWGNLIAPYYWEIYTLMGDPSLMPWLGTAMQMPFRADTASRPITINCAPNAYVALVDSATLDVIAATYAKADGTASLPLSSDRALAGTFFCATAQGFKPYIQGIDKIDLGVKVEINVYPNPSPDGRITVAGSNMTRIDIYDLGGHLVRSEKPAASICILNLSALPAGHYMLFVDTDSGPVASKLVIK